MKIIKISQSEISEKIDSPRFMGFFDKSKDKIMWMNETESWNIRLSKADQGWHTLDYVLNFLGVIRAGPIARVIPSYRLEIVLMEDASEKYKQAIISLYLNKNMSPVFAEREAVGQWDIYGDEKIKSDLSNFLETKFKLRLSPIKLPHEIALEKSKKMEGKIRKSVRLTRRKNVPMNIEASSLEISIEPKRKEGHEITYQVTNLETGVKEPLRLIKALNDDGTEINEEDAIKIMNENIERAKNNSYIERGTIGYLPDGINSDNWDFNLNKWKDSKEVQIEEDIERLMSNNKQYRTAQDFQGYFTGNVPEYAIGFLGSSAVEASQIESSFGRAHDAINLVNRFDSSLLYNISFVFNFAKSGAYGVYLSALDKAIKTKALQKKLEQQGYEVKSTNAGLTAYPKGGMKKSPEEIQKDIDNIYSELESKGGTAMGINVNSILSAAKMDASEIGSPDPDLWQWIAVLHLGGTIVHEAIHAKGHMDEGPSEQAEQSFISWALPIINEEYSRNLKSQGKEDQFVPLGISNRKRHASGLGWYKTAQQLSYYIPGSFMDRATGSDLSGRFPNGVKTDEGLAPWSMIAQQDQSIPIEKRLGRQNMSPIPRDLNQEHDIIEEQLRKYTREDQKLDPKATTEELLSAGHDEDRGYMTMEALLDEKRTKPLMVPLQKKVASQNIIKTATLFGWMNNLSISDGNTIPGLGDRVMAWDDRDEDFSQEESWIKQQPRYNPSYDFKGFYYRWIEPRFKPQLFDDMTRDYSNTHPAKRFASSVEIEPETSRILFILSTAKSKIVKKEIVSTRFVVTEDIMPVIDRLFPDSSFKISVFGFDQVNSEEEIYAVWISSPDVSEESIERAEKHIQHKSMDKDIEKIMDELLCISKQKERATKEILDTVRDICKEYDIRNIYLIGAYPRDVVMHTPLYLIENMDFGGGWGNQNIQLGSLVAERMGIQNVNIQNMSLSFVYNDISVSFGSPCSPTTIKEALEKMNIELTPLNVDVYNRDFTINMLIIDVLQDKVIDVSKNSEKDMCLKVIRTFFDPLTICKQNPMVILRALKFKIRYGFEIDTDLQKAMIQCVPMIFDGRYSSEKLIVARENIKKEGNKEAEILFSEFGLERIKELG